MDSRIGQMLLLAGIITSGELEAAEEYSRAQKLPLVSALVRLQIIQEEQLVESLSKLTGLPVVILDEMDVDWEAAKLLPVKWAVRYMAIPYSNENSVLSVAMADATDQDAIENIAFLTGLSIRAAITAESQIRKYINMAYPGIRDPFEDLGNQLKYDQYLIPETGDNSEYDPSSGICSLDLWLPPDSEWIESAVNRFVSAAFHIAIQKKATEIHFLPYKKSLCVRLRIDGVLQDLHTVDEASENVKRQVVSRLKGMSMLDVSDIRSTQEGRITLRSAGDDSLDFTVSVMPTLFGGTVCLRLLDQELMATGMSNLQRGAIMNPLDSITFDDFGFQVQGDQDNVRTWYTRDGDFIGLFYDGLPPDIAADLNSVPEVRHFYRAQVTPAGFGVVEVDTLKLDDCLAVRTIFKGPQKPSGMVYVAGITLPFRDFSYLVKVQCNEQAPTGTRDVAVFQSLLGSGEVEMNESGSVEGWSQDPYDASATAPLMRNRSEDEKYDEQFPDHPLSRLRRILGRIQDSLRISSEVKAQPAFSFKGHP